MAEDRVEGRNAVSELLVSGRAVARIYLLDGDKGDDALARIREQARERGIPVESVPRRELDRMSERGAHQGVIAATEPFRYTELDAVLAHTAGTPVSLIVALDHVTDPGNLGAVIRTADVVGADAVVIPKDRAAAMTASALKAAAGGAENVPICREPNLVRALERCKEAGYWIAGASEKAETLAWDSPLAERMVLVMGAEGTGLARLTERACDLFVRLPVRGRVGSLNVSAATAALAYEWLRRQAAEQ